MYHTTRLTRPRTPPSHPEFLGLSHRTAKSGSTGPYAVISRNLDRGHWKEISCHCLSKSCLKKIPCSVFVRPNRRFSAKAPKGKDIRSSWYTRIWASVKTNILLHCQGLCQAYFEKESSSQWVVLEMKEKSRELIQLRQQSWSICPHLPAIVQWRRAEFFP